MALTSLNMLELVEASASEDQRSLDVIGNELGVEEIESA